MVGPFANEVKVLDVTKSHVFLEIYDPLREFELGMYSGSLCFIALCIILLRKIEFNKKNSNFTKDDTKICW